MTPGLRTSPALHDPLPMRFGIVLLIVSSCFVQIEPAPYDLLAIGLLVLYFGTGLRLPREIILPTAWLGILILANLISAVFSDSSEAGYNLISFARYAIVTFYLFLTFVWFASLTKRYPEAFLNAVWGAYSVAGFIATCAGIYGYFDLGPGAEALTRNDRARGFFKDPNVLGPFLVPLILKHSFALMRPWQRHHLLRLAYLGFILFGLLLAFSRGAWGNALLALVVGSALLFCSYTRTLDRMRLASVVATGTLLLGVAILTLNSVPSLADMVEKRANLANSYDVGEDGRFDTQLKTAKYIFSNPIGTGPNREIPGAERAPHNVYIKVFSENGWLGGIAWLAFCLVTLGYGMRYALSASIYREDLIICFSAVLAITAEAIIIDTLHWRHYFLLLGILWGLIALARGSSPNNEVFEPLSVPEHAQYAR